MTVSTHNIKQGCTLPVLSAQFTNAAGAPAAIPVGGIVRFRMRSRTAAQGVYKVDAAAQVISASAGTVSYTFETTDTDTPGLYLCEFLVTYGATVQKIPTVGFDQVFVTTGL